MSAFTMMMPPEWVLVDLSGDRRAGVRQILRGWLTGLTPEQSAAAAPVLTARLEQLTSGLAEQGAIAVAMQASSLNEIGVQPTIVVRPLDVPEGSQPLDVLLALAGSEASAQLVDLPHLVALRTHERVALSRDVAAAVESLPAGLRDQAEQARAAGRLDAVGDRVAHRVRYLIGVPDDPERWVDLFASVEVGADAEGESLAGAYTELFDALAQTAGWRG